MPDEEEREPTKVTVDKREVRREIGQSPGLPQDTYSYQTHLDIAERVYGVPHYVVAGAMSYLQQTDPDNYNPDRLTLDQVKAALNKYQNQISKE